MSLITKRIEGKVANNAAFKEMFNNLAGNAHQISSTFMSNDPSTLASTKKQLQQMSNLIYPIKN